MNKIQTHPSIIAASDLLEICKPLNKLAITYFAHSRIKNDGQFTCLGTNPKFVEHYLKNKYFNADINAAASKNFGKYIVWDSLEFSGETSHLLDEAREFGHQHIFTITQKTEFGDEFYHFATDLNDPFINQVYINNIDLLENFIFYFTDKISKASSLNKAYDIQFSVDAENADYSFKNNIELISPLHRLEYLASLQNDKTHIESTSLSPQLLRCAHYLLEGKTAKQIAREMGISFRTVEHHILKIRNIFGFKNSKELIASGILNFADRLKQYD